MKDKEGMLAAVLPGAHASDTKRKNAKFRIFAKTTRAQVFLFINRYRV